MYKDRERVYVQGLLGVGERGRELLETGVGTRSNEAASNVCAQSTHASVLSVVSGAEGSGVAQSRECSAAQADERGRGRREKNVHEMMMGRLLYISLYPFSAHGERDVGM